MQESPVQIRLGSEMLTSSNSRMPRCHRGDRGSIPRASALDSGPTPRKGTHSLAGRALHCKCKSRRFKSGWVLNCWHHPTIGFQVRRRREHILHERRCHIGAALAIRTRAEGIHHNRKVDDNRCWSRTTTANRNVATAQRYC